MKLKWWTSTKKVKEYRNNFIRNGSLLQEELISFCKGKNLPIHVYSVEEVMKMSNFTHHQLIEYDAHFKIYQGAIVNEGNRAIYIKRFPSVNDFVGVEGIIREIVMAAQMSKHNNSLKLLGCCLETNLPVVIYEFPDQGCLEDYIYRNEGLLPWKLRLKIGWELSYALAYLQNGFSRPIIFRNLHARFIFLDKDYVAKLSGFYFAVLIPEDEDHVDDAIVGTTGFSAPEYASSGRLTEKTDVYCFGVLLFEILVIGRSRYHSGAHTKILLDRIKRYGSNVDGYMIVDPAISREIEENGKQQQLQEVFELALRCTANDEDDRPNMVAVADELKKLLDSN